MKLTDHLTIEKRSLSADERKEAQRALDFCRTKLAESPEPRTVLGRIADAFTQAKQMRQIRQAAVEENRRILETDLVEVLRCRPLAVVHIQQYEDEGHHYIFDVGESTLFFFGGQDYPPSKSFPNTEFELVRTEGGAVFRMNRRGEKLECARRIPRQIVKDLTVYSGAVFTFPGGLETAEEDYKRHTQAATPEGFQQWE